VVPIALVILIGLFAVQRFGTGAVGWLFGPVILLWFATIAVLGARQVIAHLGVLQALSPTWGARFMFDHGVKAWLALGGVVLCVTGAEALYADRGHFGTAPIRGTWFCIVLPAVLLCYLGQGALILSHHTTISDPFYLLAPRWARLPLVFLATAATIIASQAALTGSFSVAKQAVQLGFLPRLKIVHTSENEGQIYVPVIPARRHLRGGGDRHVHPRHDPVHRRGEVTLEHPKVATGLSRRTVLRRGGGVLHLQPDEGHARRLASAAGRRGGHGHHAHLASRTRHADTQSHRGGGIAL
jgi:hypothetical protein